MELTTEQKTLRRKIITANIQRGVENPDEYFDLMMQGGDFCMEQLSIWADIFADEEAAALERQANQLLELAAFKRAQLAESTTN